jgi:putative iron-regulated protein
MRPASAVIAIALAVAAWPAAAADDMRLQVLKTYADIAHAAYEDSLTAAQALRAAIGDFVADPNAATQTAAKQAWLAARNPYQQTEAYRFGNPAVDDWEGKVNAWPLDEGLIDYVDAGAYGTESDENLYYAANVVANPELRLGGETIDASKITPALLSDTLQEIGGVEANVATGYHAIEFLLWGQDLNGTEAGNGARPASDFDPANCTGGNCARRAEYLLAAADLLVDDLTDMVGQWAEGGAARTELMDAGPDGGIAMMLTGLGSLSYGELAGERMKLGLLLHDPEEEHDCFSDNTHNSHYYDYLGIRNVYSGRYERTDGSVVEGPSLADLVEATDPDVNAGMVAALDTTGAAMDAMVAEAENGMAYDQMIGEGNDVGNALVQNVIDGLTAQTREIERVVAALNLQAIAFEGSDSLDDPDAVFQ